VEEAPKLEDYFKFDEKDDGDEADEDAAEEEGGLGNSIQDVMAGSKGQVAESHSLSDHYDTASFKSSVDIKAGGNTLVNSVELTNKWVASTVTAVVGDHIELNAVIQITAYCDTDSVSALLAGWDNGAENATKAFNIATFEREDRTEDKEDPTGGFPKHWVIKEIHGDLFNINWVNQCIFMSDSDIGIVSAYGATTKIVTGENGAYNQVSLAELGYYYDLIIIGGNVWDANIIQQMAVMMDNDVIHTADGFQTTGAGSVSTSGNLLWNQASITTVGGQDRFDGLPDAYLKAAENLADGKQILPSGVLNDEAFQGLELLRVLYISGDMINLNYIYQCAILGDNDQIMLAMQQYGGFADADWSISTGSNSLLNLASIYDTDSLGKTYVGGGQYSDEVLIQADLVSSDPYLGAQDPGKLAYEAVAFLEDELADADDGNYSGSPDLQPDFGQSDGLQSMLG
jgi:hypothetical protein